MSTTHIASLKLDITLGDGGKFTFRGEDAKPVLTVREYLAECITINIQYAIMHMFKTTAVSSSTLTCMITSEIDRIYALIETSKHVIDTSKLVAPTHLYALFNLMKEIADNEEQAITLCDSVTNITLTHANQASDTTAPVKVESDTTAPVKVESDSSESSVDSSDSSESSDDSSDSSE